jgi:son of sevenless-like protein
MINFVKRRRVAMVIREIQQYQQTPYALEPVPKIITFLSTVDGMDEKTAFDLSLMVEPRDKQ